MTRHVSLVPSDKSLADFVKTICKRGGQRLSVAMLFRNHTVLTPVVFQFIKSLMLIFTAPIVSSKMKEWGF